MSTIFLILVLFAFAHFVYEAIIAPSRRLEQRCKLFVERDRLRTLAIANPEILDEETFEALHNRINSSIALVCTITPSVLVDASLQFHRTESLRKLVKKNARLIEDSPFEE